MWIFFDESGDFAFPDQGDFDCYVQAALICPDSVLPQLEDFVARAYAQFGVDELHATQLTGEQLVEISAFLREQDVQLLATATDTAIMSDRAIAQHRLDQAARIKENLEDFRRRGGESEEIEQWMKAMMARAALPQRISNPEYVQADFLITLIHAALKKSILAHYDDRWRDDLINFHFVLDGKLPEKLAAGEKFLESAIVPAISYDERYALGEPDWWPDEPVHPFHAKFSRDAALNGEGGLDARLIFEDGLVFADSREYAGLQLVDVVAHVVRRAVLEPSNQPIQAAYDLIRGKLRTEDGRALRIIGYRGGDHDADMEHYRPLFYLSR